MAGTHSEPPLPHLHCSGHGAVPKKHGPMVHHQRPEKKGGPRTSLTFLGILLDSISMQASITVERKEELLLAIMKLYCVHAQNASSSPCCQGITL